MRSVFCAATALFGLVCSVPGLAGAAETASSSGHGERGLYGGFAARLNFASLAIDNVPDNFLENRTAYSIGLFLGIPVSDLVTIQAEGFYTRKGGELNMNLPGFMSINSEFRLDYIEFAPMLQVQLPLQSTVRVFGEAGPVFGINVAGEFEVSAPLEGISETEDIKDDLEDFEFGIAFGAGIGIPVEKIELLFGIRYHMGLTSITDVFSGEGLGAEPYTRNLQFQAGIAF